MQKILSSTLIDKRELLWEALCQALGCAPVIEEESVPLQISFTKTNKIQLWWTWPREGITYSFSLAVLLGSLQTFIPSSVMCKHYKIHNSPVNSFFFNVFVYCPPLAYEFMRAVHSAFPGAWALAFSTKPTNQFFLLLKIHLKISVIDFGMSCLLYAHIYL